MRGAAFKVRPGYGSASSDVRFKLFTWSKAESPQTTPSRSCQKSDERPLWESADKGLGVRHGSIGGRPLFQPACSEADRPLTASFGLASWPFGMTGVGGFPPVRFGQR